MRLFRKYFSRYGHAILLACALTLGAMHPASAQDLEDQTTQLLHALDALSARADMTVETRADAFLALAESRFEFDTIAAASLPRNQSLSPATQADYLAAFRTHLSLSYGETVRRFGPSTSRFVGLRQRQDRPTIAFVDTTSGTTTRRSSWGLCPTPNLRICSIDVDGVRLSRQLRADFTKIVARDGIAAFLEALRSGALVQR